MNNPKPAVLFHQHPEGVPVPEGKKGRPGSSRLGNPSQKHEARKLFVRNSEMTVFPTLYKSDARPEEDDSNDCPRKSPPSQELYKTDLSAPNLNSALRIVKEINLATRKPSFSQCIKLVDEGKVLQKLNFPYEEHLYHDLVALTGPVPGSSARSSNRYPTRDRDKEPQLSQFFTPSYSPEYRTSRQTPARAFEKFHIDSASVYHRVCSWDIQD